jgi:hypothetical protein
MSVDGHLVDERGDFARTLISVTGTLRPGATDWPNVTAATAHV